MPENDTTEEKEWVRGPEHLGSVWSRIARAIYNPKERSFLGRTAKRWGIVLVFYLVFYAALALLFGICMAGLVYHIDATTPTYTLDRSLIGSNPGVTYRPRPNDGIKISIDINNFTETNAILKDLDEFFQPYLMDSSYKSENGCKSDDNYGYPDTPCLFIKINKIYGWTPVYYESTDLPADMPEDLVEHIKGLDANETKRVWISCLEEKDNGTTIEYPWGQGIQGSSFPFLNKEGQTSPVVAVRITPPVGKLIALRCRAWAKNIQYRFSIKDFSGYTPIQVEVENSANVTV
ncbi:sodium/potassium-transporting ATPase subunit beta-1 [Bombyx mori]|uniref:Uncharacterized protein n=1 Tax=Bombyx mori TaxID=7091 RepID=A0A8R1WIJ8_BOMMO|nr:sodium/potassium-transporting ATPase subunit beta-1 [Bombyx mori]